MNGYNNNMTYSSDNTHRISAMSSSDMRQIETAIWRISYCAAAWSVNDQLNHTLLSAITDIAQVALHYSTVTLLC